MDTKTALFVKLGVGGAAILAAVVLALAGKVAGAEAIEVVKWVGSTLVAGAAVLGAVGATQAGQDRRQAASEVFAMKSEELRQQASLAHMAAMRDLHPGQGVSASTLKTDPGR